MSANDMLYTQRNAADNGNVQDLVSFPATDAVFIYEASSLKPKTATLGPGLSLVAGVLDAATAAPSQSSASRSLNSAFQVNASRNALVNYSVQITTTASIGSGQNGDVILEIAADSGFTTSVQTLAIFGNGQTYTLAVAIQGVQVVTAPLQGFVPAGFYARLRTVNNTGTPSFSFRAGQEVLM